MARALIINNRGDVEVDPFDQKGKFEKWVQSITTREGIDYFSFTRVSRAHSRRITEYILDLAKGKNTARGQRRGPRCYGHLVHVRYHLQSQFVMFERETGKLNMDFTEDDILGVFNRMRGGAIKNQKNKAFLDVRTYAKVFCAFWHWHMRTQEQEGIVVRDIVRNVDTTADRKPEWHHFTLKDVEKMADLAPRFEYKALVYFLFDSGIRAPKEMMNVRVMDLTPVPGTNNLFLNIREETSKTFGRKIKLMLCADIIKKYIEQEKLGPTDFLFKTSAVAYNRVVAKLGYAVLGKGTPHYQRRRGGEIHKTIVRQGITMYDFRHNSVCHYLPIYKSENQLKYRYGWKKADMIVYYSEYIGMKDTITDEDMVVDTTKAQLEQQLSREQQKMALLSEQFESQRCEMEERMNKMEARMLQQFADKFSMQG